MRKRYATSRLLAALLILPLLAACAGYAPLYAVSAEGEAGISAELAQIAVMRIAERDGQILRNHLVDRLNAGGTPQNPTYLLETRLSERDIAMALDPQNDRARAEFELTARYRLIEAATGEVLTQGTAQSFTSYYLVEPQFGALRSRDDARQRGLKDLSDRITRDLALHFR